MASVCFYFQLHQPRRLRRYSVFDAETDYFDEAFNEQILKKVAEKCYLPATMLLRDLVQRHDGRFRFAFSLTGEVIEQFRQWCPEMIDLLRELAATGCVEFLGETYHHSLAFIYSRSEFHEQVAMHRKLIEELFNQSPRVFRNTELIYSNELAAVIRAKGDYHGILCEGVDRVLDGREPNHLFHPPGSHHLAVLLKNYRLSDDIAFRFSAPDESGETLTAQRFAEKINRINETGDLCNLFMDFETFGEHQWRENGIFAFLEHLPEAILTVGDGGNDFKTPSECIETYEAADEFDCPHMVSWADTERDLSAWIGNAMQSNALHALFKLEETVKRSGDEQLLLDWRRLSASDHFYYMCTKYFDDGDVHKYFSPYESPYDSYINVMNVLDSFRSRAESI